jgi:hypothetical protein
MTQQHPITPPLKLVQEWASEFYGAAVLAPGEAMIAIATEAARWGADQELDACVEWVVNTRAYDMTPGCLRAARRPNSSSLKEQALERCNDYIDPDGIIRCALEQLKDD